MQSSVEIQFELLTEFYVWKFCISVIHVHHVWQKLQDTALKFNSVWKGKIVGFFKGYSVTVANTLGIQEGRQDYLNAPHHSYNMFLCYTSVCRNIYMYVYTYMYTCMCMYVCSSHPGYYHELHWGDRNVLLHNKTVPVQRRTSATTCVHRHQGDVKSCRWCHHSYQQVSNNSIYIIYISYNTGRNNMYMYIQFHVPGSTD